MYGLKIKKASLAKNSTTAGLIRIVIHLYSDCQPLIIISGQLQNRIMQDMKKRKNGGMGIGGVRKRKGQYITLENLFFFAVGVALVITVYAVFSGISENLRSAALQDQLGKEGESMRAGVVRAFLAGNSTSSSVSLSLEIPKTLSGCIYRIAITDGNLIISCMENQASSALNLYGIETNVKNGAAYSSSGKINIFYSGGSVMIS